jgi:hypothetical protein
MIHTGTSYIALSRLAEGGTVILTRMEEQPHSEQRIGHPFKRALVKLSPLRFYCELGSDHAIYLNFQINRSRNMCFQALYSPFRA